MCALVWMFRLFQRDRYQEVLAWLQWCWNDESEGWWSVELAAVMLKWWVDEDKKKRKKREWFVYVRAGVYILLRHLKNFPPRPTMPLEKLPHFCQLTARLTGRPVSHRVVSHLIKHMLWPKFCIFLRKGKIYLLSGKFCKMGEIRLSLIIIDRYN